VAVVLLLVGVASLVMWSAHSDPRPAAGTTTTSPTPPPGATARADESSGRAGVARPVAVSIPAIGVSSRLDGLGLNRDGTVEVPEDPGVAGWYRLGTRPGARGSAVILGHVDSMQGPAVFYRLSSLHRGDGVRVELADGSFVRFRVRSVAVYPIARFPAEKVYAARGHRILNLVTCGGEYDAAAGGYQANVVVQTRWVGTSPA
jgi:hypothetical protein